MNKNKDFKHLCRDISIRFEGKRVCRGHVMRIAGLAIRWWRSLPPTWRRTTSPGATTVPPSAPSPSNQSAASSTTRCRKRWRPKVPTNGRKSLWPYRRSKVLKVSWERERERERERGEREKERQVNQKTKQTTQSRRNFNGLFLLKLIRQNPKWSRTMPCRGRLWLLYLISPTLIHFQEQW